VAVAPPPALFGKRSPAEPAAPAPDGAAPILVADAGPAAQPPAAAPPPAARAPLALTLKPARLAAGRGGKTTLQIDGDGAVLQLGPDADIDAIADQLKAALEKR
jgi:hypothetical protein